MSISVKHTRKHEGRAALSRPEMPNTEIESRESRARLATEQADVCIGIEPGDELGQLFVNVQCEGAVEQYDICMKGQNELLIKASEWLHDLFGNSGADWEVRIDAQPCPKAKVALDLERAAAVLEHREQRSAVETEQRINVERTRERPA